MVMLPSKQRRRIAPRLLTCYVATSCLWNKNGSALLQQHQSTRASSVSLVRQQHQHDPQETSLPIVLPTCDTSSRWSNNHWPLYGAVMSASSTPPPDTPDQSKRRNKTQTHKPNKKPYQQQHHSKIRRRQQKYPNHNPIKVMFSQAKKLERQGQWKKATELLNKILIVNPKDAHSYLALARLEASRESTIHDSRAILSTLSYSPPLLKDSHDVDDAKKSSITQSEPSIESHTTTSIENANARIEHSGSSSSPALQLFQKGTTACPKSVHLWQAWAVYEEHRGHSERARELFEQALQMEPKNPYVCHAFGLMEKKQGDAKRAATLFQTALEAHSTAALVCSLGEIMIASGKHQQARSLYHDQFPNLKCEKDRIEVLLAMAWLEERYFKSPQKAEKALQTALSISPRSNLATVALARLEGRMEQRNNNRKDVKGVKATTKRLADACDQLEKGTHTSGSDDGRVFNALASLEIKARRYDQARKILQRGMKLYPQDHALHQAAGNIEQRVGNVTEARRLYSKSLELHPSAPALVSYALLEVKNPESGVVNHTTVCGLFEEALLLDPRHGPAYNAYGTTELRLGHIDEARNVYARGVRAGCSDVASLFHGYGKLEISLGNIDKARDILQYGIGEVKKRGVGCDSIHRDRAKFLSHTLGMLELNSNRPKIALDVFEDGLRRCGKSSRLLLGAALCEMRMGKEDSARKRLEQSVLADKRHPQAWQAWGIMETKAGNFDIASRLFQCGIRHSPSHGALWQAYALLETRKGNIANARVLFAGGLEKAPDYVPLYQGWANLELREENYQAARRLIAESLTRKKQSGAAWLIAAQIEEEDGKLGLVGLLLRRGIECAPNDAGLYCKLGDFLASRGRIDDARQVFEKGMELNPSYAPIFHSLAELEARIGNFAGLANLNKRASTLFPTSALEAKPQASQAFGNKIRARRFQQLPRDVAALAEQIVEDDSNRSALGIHDIESVDPLETLATVTGGKLMQEQYIEDLTLDN